MKSDQAVYARDLCYVIVMILFMPLFILTTHAQDGDRPAQVRPRRDQRTRPIQKPHGIAPTRADFRYGPHERNVFDFWRAESDRPTPVLVSIHGGGFRNGSKEGAKAGGRVPECLEAGISFAAINYRLSGHAPYPAQMHDAARALQTIRHHAGQWNIDPERIAVTGGSAGAGISLWLSFHEDMADPDSHDPIARQSTRTVCALVNNMQSTYDPRIMDKIVLGGLIKNGKKPHEAVLHGLPEDFDWINGSLTSEQEALIKDSAPINHLTQDDPPVYIIHTERVNVPGNVHHPNFGRGLKKEMDALGIECVFHMDSDFKAPDWSGESSFDFLKRQFDLSASSETIKVFSGEPRLLVVNGYSTSFHWWAFLQRKIDRYLQYEGGPDGRVVEVQSVTKGGTPIAGWMNADTGERSVAWKQMLIPTIKQEAGRRPVIVLAQQSLQRAFGSDGRAGIRDANDGERIEHGADVLERYAKNLLEDGAPANQSVRWRIESRTRREKSCC